MQVLTGRRSSVQIGTPSPPSTTITNSSVTTSSYPTPPKRVSSDKSLLTSSHSHSHPHSSHSPTTYHHLKRIQLQGLSSSTTNLLDDVPVDLSPLPGRSRKSSSSPKHPRLTRASSMTSLGPNDASGLNEIVRCVCVCVCVCVHKCVVYASLCRNVRLCIRQCTEKHVWTFFQYIRVMFICNLVSVCTQNITH